MYIWYTSKVTYIYPTNSKEFCCAFRRIAMRQAAECPYCVCGMSHALSAERPCSVCRSSKLCLQIVHALYVLSIHQCITYLSTHKAIRMLDSECLCCVCRMSVLGLLIVRALSTDRPCSVRRMSVLSAHQRITDLSTHKAPIVVARMPSFPKLLIVVAEMKGPNNSQDACYSISR